MATQIATGAIHYITLTVTDVERTAAFYADLLNFQKVAEFGPRVLLSNGTVIVALGLPTDPAGAGRNDGFDENRIGLDHVSFAVENRAALEAAVRRFDEQGVSHGEITDLGPELGIYILAFRDPDNIQLELTAPYS